MKKVSGSLLILFLIVGVCFAASDDFTDSNGTALESHDAKWTMITTTYDVAHMEIQSNICQLESGETYGGAYYDDSQSANQMCQAVWKAASSSASKNKTICVRMANDRGDTSNYGYEATFGFYSGGNWSRVYIRKNASDQTFASGTWSAASDHTVKISVVGSGQNNVYVSVWVDGNLEIDSWQDTEVATINDGNPGFRINNLAVSDSLIDDWTDADAVAPVAAFSGTPTSGEKPLEVTFTDASTNTPTSWAWDFGDLSCPAADECNDQNPVHEYADAGTYTVVLTATNVGGSDDETKEDYITVSEPAPVAAFSADDTTPNCGDTVTFTDASTGEITDWEWDFGDGDTSTDQNPTHVFAGAGSRTVTLTVYGPGGTDDEEKAAYIAVTCGTGLARRVIQNFMFGGGL
jgi:PKD repeat protein